MSLESYDEDEIGVNNPSHPANQKEVPTPQVTIDEWYYEELKHDAKVLKELRKLMALLR